MQIYVLAILISRHLGITTQLIHCIDNWLFYLVRCQYFEPLCGVLVGLEERGAGALLALRRNDQHNRQRGTKDPQSSPSLI